MMSLVSLHEGLWNHRAGPVLACCRRTTSISGRKANLNRSEPFIAPWSPQSDPPCMQPCELFIDVGPTLVKPKCASLERPWAQNFCLERDAKSSPPPFQRFRHIGSARQARSALSWNPTISNHLVHLSWAPPTGPSSWALPCRTSGYAHNTHIHSPL
jgi:hypothetical protein